MVDWSRPLTRVLILKTGERLRTLHDAAELFMRRFQSVLSSAPPEHAIGLLLRAAETGTRADRKAATDQVALAGAGRDGAAAPRDPAYSNRGSIRREGRPYRCQATPRFTSQGDTDFEEGTAVRPSGRGPQGSGRPDLAVM